jgi:hypothetical protein
MNTFESPALCRSLTVPASKVGVFICSSDSRRDILDRVLPSLFKYWPDCPYSIYVGLNSSHGVSPNVTTLVAQNSEWRTETLEQVAQTTETHLIVVLDDYLFQERVDQSRLSMLINEAVSSKLPYLRLLPLRKSLMARLFYSGRNRTVGDIQAINEKRPFYSSLQIAIWNKAHFLSLLERPGSVWDFEHQKPSCATHYAITDRPPIAYSHLVEKGRWLPYARTLLSRAGLATDLGKRPVWPKWAHLRRVLDEVRFHVVGYANH